MVIEWVRPEVMATRLDVTPSWVYKRSAAKRQCKGFWLLRSKDQAGRIVVAAVNSNTFWPWLKTRIDWVAQTLGLKRHQFTHELRNGLNYELVGRMLSLTDAVHKIKGDRG